jgi:hypothetical protein
MAKYTNIKDLEDYHQESIRLGNLTPELESEIKSMTQKCANLYIYGLYTNHLTWNFVTDYCRTHFMSKKDGEETFSFYVELIKRGLIIFFKNQKRILFLEDEIISYIKKSIK